MDSFTKEIRAIMEAGTLASMSGNSFKALIVKKVQVYSAEIGRLKEDIPELFLNLTDLILSGSLSKMPPDALRVYMSLGVLDGSNSKWPSEVFAAKLSQLSGLEDETILKKALLELKALGYIDSPEEPALKRLKLQKENRLHDYAEPE